MRDDEAKLFWRDLHWEVRVKKHEASYVPSRDHGDVVEAFATLAGQGLTAPSGSRRTGDMNAADYNSEQ